MKILHKFKLPRKLYPSSLSGRNLRPDQLSQILRQPKLPRKVPRLFEGGDGVEPELTSHHHLAANFARRQNSAQSASRSAWSFALNSSNTKRRIRASALLRNSGSRSL